MRTSRAFLPLVAGPLAILAFFSPLADGWGILAGEQFTGLELARFIGALQQLELSVAERGLLWAARVAIILVPIAGLWLTILAPRWRWHPAYTVSAWYVFIAGAASVALVGAAAGFRSDSNVAWPAGVILLTSGALARVGSGQR